MNPLMVSTGDVLVLDPRDVVLRAVGVVAGAVPLDQRLERVGHRLAGERDRRLEVRDDLGDLLRVAAVDAGRPLRRAGRSVFTRREFSPYLLGEALQVGHADAGVEVVGAGGEDVLARPRMSCW